MPIPQDPFLWAFVAMCGLLASTAIVSGTRLGRCPPFGFMIVSVWELARVILVLPICPQPRFDIGGWNWAAGAVSRASAFVFASAALSIKPWAAPDESMTLRTTGLYGVVRNPVYLADILISLGFAIGFGSIIGVALIPVWWAGFLLIALIEEQSLERVLGQSYLDYRQKVRGRIIPGLPI